MTQDNINTLFNFYNMKKNLFTAAVAAIALAGCVSNEADVSHKGDAKISFAAPLVSGVTRAVTGEIANPYPTEESFVVNAKYYADTFTTWADGQSYMADVVAEYSAADNAWAPSDHDYYWPKTGSLTFFAYSPADFEGWAPAIGVAGEAEALTASQVAIAAGDVDLLYSSLAADKTANDNISGNNYSGVEIKFNHALSSIKFKTRLTSELSGAKIVVNGVKLAKVNSKGDFSWSLDAEAAPQWSNASEAVEYVAVEGAEQEVAYDDAVDLENAASLILLPQALKGAADEDNVVAIVTYTILHEGETEGIEQVSTVDLSALKYGDQAVAEWLPGKRYIYTIHFGMTKILFDPEVKDWEDVIVTE